MLSRRNGSLNERKLALIPRVLYSHWLFKFRILTAGTSEYKLNDKTVTYSAYNTSLISHNILVNASRFLVFQVDVEAVVSQSPRELPCLMEQISGSLELALEYEKAKEAQEWATENATFNFTKQRGIAGEIKQYREQKSEADRFDALCQKRVSAITNKIPLLVNRVLGSIYPGAYPAYALSYRPGNRKQFANYRQKKQWSGWSTSRTHDKALEGALADQAKTRTTMMQKEKHIKKAEKALDAKVSFTLNNHEPLLIDHSVCRDLTWYQRRPNWAHSRQKLSNVIKSKEALLNRKPSFKLNWRHSSKS